MYDASGAKLQKIVKNNTATPEVFNYVNGVEYKDNVLQRLAHTEGAVVRQVYGPTGAISFDHEYVLRDHLGNVRVTFTDGISKGDPYWRSDDPYGYYWTYVDPNEGNTGYHDGVITQDDIKIINSYYPFGMDQEGNWNGSFDAVNNRYKYNEKEWNNDFGLGLYDYGARFYDPAVGRWWNVDPLAQKHVSQTPYNYVSNNPIKMIDPDGRDGIIIINRKDKSVTVRVNCHWSPDTHRDLEAHKIQNNYVTNREWTTLKGGQENWSSNGLIRKTKIRGSEYNVSYDIGIKEHPTHKEAVEASRKTGQNFLCIRNGPRPFDKKEDSNVSRNQIELNYGQMKDNPTTASHEIFHLMGVGENSYTDEKGVTTMSNGADPNGLNRAIITQDVFNTVEPAVEFANSIGGDDDTVYFILTNGDHVNRLTQSDKDGNIIKGKDGKPITKDYKKVHHQ